MKKQITEVSIFQSSKVLAIFGCLVSLVYAIPLGILALYNQEKDVAIVLFAQPFVHLILGFIVSIIAFFIYNQVAKIFGGIEIHTEDKIS